MYVQTNTCQCMHALFATKSDIKNSFFSRLSASVATAAAVTGAAAGYHQNLTSFWLIFKPTFYNFYFYFIFFFIYFLRLFFIFSLYFMPAFVALLFWNRLQVDCGYIHDFSCNFLFGITVIFVSIKIYLNTFCLHLFFVFVSVFFYQSQVRVAKLKDFTSGLEWI